MYHTSAIARWGGLILAGLLALFLLLRLTATPATSWLYDWGFWGLYPQVRYKSFELTSPMLNFPVWNQECDDGSVYLLAPRGTIISDPGPMILDARGNLVWKSAGYGEITDLKAQRYKDKSYLTFWAGHNADSHRYGSGMYYMLNDAYEIYKTFQPVGETLKGDLHEFSITESGTALMTAYHPVPGDLSSIGGPSQGWLLDSIFQEVDIETGKLIFEWRASEHIPVNHTMRAFRGADIADKPVSGFDYFHINSVDKDSDGNYIISGRHSHQIVCISGVSGKVLWILGGKHNMFQDLSAGRATNFWWQHHVRVHANSTISLFDNSKSETGDEAYYGQYSRGVLLRLDAKAMRVEALQEYADPRRRTLAQSQGSMQMLDSGKVALDYGFLPTFSQFAADGQLLCEMRIAPWVVFQFGMVTSYRMYTSTDWVGRPTDSPKVFLHPPDKKLFVSWNGATKVHSWSLQGAEWDGVQQDDWAEYSTREKDGFEGAFDITTGMPDYLRVVALAADKKVLGHSEIVRRSKGNAPLSPLPYRVMLVLGPIVGLVMVLCLLFGKHYPTLWRRRLGYRLIRLD